MKLYSEKYRLLSDEENEENEASVIPKRQRIPPYAITLTIILILTLGYNIYISARYLQLSYMYQLQRDDRTPFAGLSSNTDGAFKRGGIYMSENRTISDAAWDAIDFSPGFVALEHEYAAEKGLPLAQDFPWDNSKGIYLINAYHHLHCLRLIRKMLQDFHDGIPVTASGFEHNLHCLNSIREEIVCTADDTPLYTSFAHPGTVGFDQPRKCRDWGALEHWAKEHTACWRQIHYGEKINTLLRYRYCPADSPYNEKIHEVFGDFEKEENADV